MSTPHQHQHGVTIGGKRYTVDQDGKFVPIPVKTGAEPAGNGQNGNNVPKEDA